MNEEIRLLVGFPIIETCTVFSDLAALDQVNM